MKYIFTEASISGIFHITLKEFEDNRGSFIETFREVEYERLNLPKRFVQDMRSISKKNVLRGLHFQIQNPAGQLVYATRGKFLDVGVDLRQGSKTFGLHKIFILEETVPAQVYYPPGIAHGFLALDEINELRYKTTEYYNPEDEGGLNWADQDISIDWKTVHPIVSERDNNFKFFKDLNPHLLPRV